jgi:hypothetical protein
MVLKSIKNITFFPGKSNLANPYATRVSLIISPVIPNITINNVLERYFENGIAFHASAKLCHCGGLGIHSGGHAKMSASDLSAVDIIQKNGISIIIANPITMI